MNVYLCIIYLFVCRFAGANIDKVFRYLVNDLRDADKFYTMGYDLRSFSEANDYISNQKEMLDL